MTEIGPVKCRVLLYIAILILISSPSPSSSYGRAPPVRHSRRRRRRYTSTISRRAGFAASHRELVLWGRIPRLPAIGLACFLCLFGSSGESSGLRTGSSSSSPSRWGAGTGRGMWGGTATARAALRSLRLITVRTVPPRSSIWVMLARNLFG